MTQIKNAITTHSFQNITLLFVSISIFIRTRFSSKSIQSILMWIHEIYIVALSYYVICSVVEKHSSKFDWHFGINAELVTEVTMKTNYYLLYSKGNLGLKVLSSLDSDV